jgi:hypothetical protein
MAHGLDSTKTPARPSHEAVEGVGSEDEFITGKTEEEKLDGAARRKFPGAQFFQSKDERHARRG